MTGTGPTIIVVRRGEHFRCPNAGARHPSDAAQRARRSINVPDVVDE